MPISRAGDIARRIARLLDAEPSGIGETVSPEIVPVIIAGDVQHLSQRRGLLAADVAAGAVNTRSEIHVVAVGGRLGADEIVVIDALLVSTQADFLFEVFVNIATAAFTDVEGSNADVLYGPIAPVRIGTKNTAAKTAGGVNFMGGLALAQADDHWVFPLGIVLRDRFAFPGGANDMIVRPDLDQVRMTAAFAWHVERDVR